MFLSYQLKIKLAGFQFNCAFYGKSLTYPPDGSSSRRNNLPLTFRIETNSPVATPICSIVNLVAVRSVLFFDMEVIMWVYRCFLAWLPERQLWGTLGICINPRWPLWTPGSPPDGISFK